MGLFVKVVDGIGLNSGQRVAVDQIVGIATSVANVGKPESVTSVALQTLAILIFAKTVETITRSVH